MKVEIHLNKTKKLFRQAIPFIGRITILGQ
jgi:hypothetical protein